MRAFGQPITSGGTAPISIRLVVRPWTTRPAMKTPLSGAQAASTEPSTKSDAKTTSSRRAGSRWISCTAATVPKQ